MALGLMEKMGLQKQARTLQSEIMAGDLAVMAKLAKQKAWREVMLKLQADAAPVVDPAPVENPTPEPPAVNPLFEQYKAGKFNDLAADQFRAKIVEVADAGLEFEQVKQGVVTWIDANPSLIVEAA